SHDFCQFSPFVLISAIVFIMSSSRAQAKSSSSSSRTFKPKASEVAHETKKSIIPRIQTHYADKWGTWSYYFQDPLAQVSVEPDPHANPTNFSVYVDDPVNYALHWLSHSEPGAPVAFICAANEKRPGGDWVTGVVGYEERLCRRSTLSATLSTAGPGSHTKDSYPISSVGGIFSPQVVIFRSETDRSEPLMEEQWQDIPVCSVPPVRWPKVNMTSGVLQYSFADERDLMREKITGALAICYSRGITNIVGALEPAEQFVSRIVVGDFGLGNGHRNPPSEVAQLWWEVTSSGPLHGRIHNIAFIFEDARQSTRSLILEDLAKKHRKNGGIIPLALANALREPPVSDYDEFLNMFGH
ncbi:uncharacterized protein PpBr36_06167, partial [Pyricularia pennisetigena]|uniref:uncharacterized protein n=1 Tax=Pyricularia pennisetigena TaxID=1578925 RepID=UPI001154376E